MAKPDLLKRGKIFFIGAATSKITERKGGGGKE